MNRKVSHPQWRRPSLMALALTLVVALAVAACGSSSSTTSGGGASSAPTGSDAASTGSTQGSGGSSSGDTIKVMTIVDYTTPNGRVDFNQLNGVEGAINAANASGGINGKHIVLLHCDAHSSPSAAAACANEAIHSGAVAIVNNQVNEDFITTPLLMKAGIPIVGNNPSTPPGQSDPNSACFVTSTVPTFVGMVTALAQQDHVKKIGVLEPPIPGAVQINAALKAAAQVNGVQITNIVPVGFTVTNFGPALQQVLSGGTEAIIPFAGGGPPALAALIQQAKQINPNVKFVFPSFELTPPFLAAAGPAEQGSLAVGYTQFSSATSSPGVAEFQSEVSKINQASTHSDTALWAWTGAHGFVKLAQSIQGPITRASVSTALKGLKNLDLGGVTPPYTYGFNTYGLGCIVNGSPAVGRISRHGVAAISGNNLINVMTPSVVEAVKKYSH